MVGRVEHGGPRDRGHGAEAGLEAALHEPPEEHRLEQAHDERHPEQRDPLLGGGQVEAQHGHGELRCGEDDPDDDGLAPPLRAQPQAVQVAPATPHLVDHRADDADEHPGREAQEQPEHVVGGEHPERQDERRDDARVGDRDGDEVGHVHPGVDVRPQGRHGGQGRADDHHDGGPHRQLDHVEQQQRSDTEGEPHPEPGRPRPLRVGATRRGSSLEHAHVHHAPRTRRRVHENGSSLPSSRGQPGPARRRDPRNRDHRPGDGDRPSAVSAEVAAGATTSALTAGATA